MSQIVDASFASCCSRSFSLFYFERVESHIAKDFSNMFKKPHYIKKMKCQARDKSLLSCRRNNFYSKSGCLIESEFGLETPSNSPMFKVGDPKQFEICHLNLSSGL